MSDRTQCVNINGVLSYTKELTFSVPQDSVFGPTLYCLYTRSIVVFGLSYNSFADDTQLHVKTTSIASVMCWETLAVSVNTSSFLTVKRFPFFSHITSRPWKCVFIWTFCQHDKCFAACEKLCCSVDIDFRTRDHMHVCHVTFWVTREL